MKKINFFETNLINNYTVLNFIDEVTEAFKSKKITNFLIKDEFRPGEKIESIVEEKASKNNLIINYTDNNHNVLISNSSRLPTIMSTSFLKKYQVQIKQVLKEEIVNTNSSSITITDLVFDDELFNILLTKKNKTLFFQNVKLTNQQIEKLQDNFINAYLENKQISTKNAISYYTKEDLETKNELSLPMEVLKESKTKNFRFLPDNAIINIYQNISDLRSEEEVLSIIKEKLDDIEKIDKPLIVKIDVKKRSIFSKIFQECHFKNISLIIKNDNFEYPIEQYLEEEKKLESLVEKIKTLELSPLEKYFAVYNIVKNYKLYKENPNNKEEARYLRYILDNEYMVCVGFAKLLVELLDKVGINANEFSISVDTSYDTGFTVEEKIVDMAGHRRAIVSLDDDKYNVHGLYMADPTWDNSPTNNYLNNALIPFDKLQITNRMFKYSTYNVILDIHNFQEFNQQVNFLLKRELKEMQVFSPNTSFQEILLRSYEMVCTKILNTLKCDLKYQEFITNLNNCQVENDYINFLTKLGNYLLTRINKHIPDETILKAFNASYQKTTNSKKIDYEDLKKEYLKREELSFPYEIPDNEDLKLTSKRQ